MDLPIISIIKTVTELYGIYVLLGLVVFIITIVFLIFLVSIFTKTPFGFGIGFFKINFGSRDAVNKVALVKNLIEYQQESTEKIMRLEYSCIKRQLNYTEQKLSQFKYILNNNYLSLLTNKISQDDDLKLHKDYRSYQILIGMLTKELLSKIFEEAFIENHLEDFDEAGWKSYLNDKSNYILNYSAEFLDYMYGDGRLVTRKESSESEKKLFPEIKTLTKVIFDNARNCPEISESISKQSHVFRVAQWHLSKLAPKQFGDKKESTVVLNVHEDNLKNLK